MGRKLYLECASGISGDMTVGALLDLGASTQVLKEALMSLPLSGYRVVISKKKKSAIDCVDFDVILKEDNHDHDMEYLYGENYEEHHHEDHHEHDHHHEQHHHEHEHHHGRHLSEIIEIINAGKMNQNAKDIAIKIFNILGEAEAKAHGTTLEEVHFHEVGAVDSIIDIVSIGVCLDNLGIDEVIIDKVSEGKGTVRSAHGVLPVPVPAVSNIMSNYQIPMKFMNKQGEFVTPTGIAIIAAMWKGNRISDEIIFEKVGYGSGKREYDGPGYLRAMLVKEVSRNYSDVDIIKLETNVDDCTGEAIGYVMEKLFNAGAYDVHVSNVYMKKNRPGWMISVICDEDNYREMEKIIFRETTTIGIRRVKMKSTKLDRKIVDVETEYGLAKVKVVQNGDVIRYYPEYETVKKLCDDTGISYQEMFQNVLLEAKRIK